MVDEDYPLRLPGMMDHKYLDYAFTSDFYNEVTADSPMFAVDCEMVMTKDGMELARYKLKQELAYVKKLCRAIILNFDILLVSASWTKT